jgi:serine O-acetyltransferase
VHPRAKLGSVYGRLPGGNRWRGWQRAERLWLLSIALHQRGHPALANCVKKLNTLVYHNFLPVEASVSPDIRFGHHGFGIMVHGSVVVGRNVKIFHHVTLTVIPQPAVPAKLIIEDGVTIGASAVVVAPIGRSLRIGRGARIGAGAVVSEDVPAGATVVSQPPRVLTHRSETRLERVAKLEDQPLRPPAGQRRRRARR